MTLKELSQLYWLKREIALDQARLTCLELEIEEDRERLTCLESQVLSPSSPSYDGLPKVRQNSGSFENVVASSESLRESIAQKEAHRSACVEIIQSKQIRCLAERAKLEKYIDDLPTSLLRMIFTLRFVDCLTWDQVSVNLGVRTTPESVRKMCYRHLAGDESKMHT